MFPGQHKALYKGNKRRFKLLLLDLLLYLRNIIKDFRLSSSDLRKTSIDKLLFLSHTYPMIFVMSAPIIREEVQLEYHNPALSFDPALLSV